MKEGMKVTGVYDCRCLVFNTLQSESVNIRIHTDDIKSVLFEFLMKKTFPTNINMSYLPLAVSQHVSSTRSGRVERAEESC